MDSAHHGEQPVEETRTKIVSALQERLKQTAVVEGVFFALGLLGGLIAQAAYALAISADGVSRLQTFALTNVYSLASVMVGGLLGFLFGVPRFRSGNGRAESTVTPNTALPNTNLEEISDWLTKIIVGVSLVQIANIGDAARRLFETLGAALGTGESAAAFAGCLVVFAGGLGFIFGWLGARTWIAWLLKGPDTETSDRSEAHGDAA